ncbi:unnamed protein product [Lota lota]
MDNDQHRGGAASRWGRDASSHDTKNKFNHRQVPEEREQGPGVSEAVRGLQGLDPLELSSSLYKSPAAARRLHD